MPLIGSYTFVTEGLLGLLNDGVRYLQGCSFYHWHALTVRLQQGFYRKIRPSGYLEAKIFRWANLSGENVAGEMCSWLVVPGQRHITCTMTVTSTEWMGMAVL